MGTLKEELERIGGSRDANDVEQTLEHVHRTLADTVALLDLEIEVLWNHEADVDDTRRYEKVKALIREAHKVKSQIADIGKTSNKDEDEKSALNLEEARAEILRRLARIAAVDDEGEISG